MSVIPLIGEDGAALNAAAGDMIRPTNNGVFSGSTKLTDVAYVPGYGSRLSHVHDATNRIIYTYHPDSPNIARINFYSPLPNLRLSTHKTYDNLDRLTSVVHSNAALGAFSAFRYALNNANQRTAITSRG